MIVRILAGLITSKAIAAYVGPAGMGLVGNLRNFLSSVEIFSTLGLQNGVIKYTAEHAREEEKLYKVFTTVFLTLLVVCIILSATLIIFSDTFSNWIFSNTEFKWIIKAVAYSLPWYASSFILISILSGLGNYKQVIGINITGNLLGVALSVFMMWKYNTDGALLGLIFYQAFLFIGSGYLVVRKFKFRILDVKNYDFSVLRNLSSYSVMTIVPALLLPVVYIEIRNSLFDGYGIESAGFYEAMMRISSFYMMFATTMMTLYFFPKLSAAEDGYVTRKVILNYYKTMLPLFAICLTILYFLRSYAVLFILKEDFMPVTQLFLWQLLGDFFKIGSMILGYQFFAKKLTVGFIISEVISFTLLYFSSIFLIGKYGTEGAVMAHAITFFMLWVALIVYFRKIVF